MSQVKAIEIAFSQKYYLNRYLSLSFFPVSIFLWKAKKSLKHQRKWATSFWFVKKEGAVNIKCRTIENVDIEKMGTSTTVTRNLIVKLGHFKWKKIILYKTTQLLDVPLSPITGVARLFWLRAKFENYFSYRAALFKITDLKVAISAKHEKIGSFGAFLRRSHCSFRPILS